MSRTPHEALADHLSGMDLTLPYREALVELLRENLSEAEARAALLLPADGPPLEPVAVEDLSASPEHAAELRGVLEGLAARGFLYSRNLGPGRTGYALHRPGFGFPQSFFWKGEDTPHARQMTRLVLKYFDRTVTAEAFGGEGTKPYRYIPVAASLSPQLQAVYPAHGMEAVLDGATTFALAHCPCRVQARLMGRACDHPTEVCLKFDEMALFLIERGLGREISREEARATVKAAAGAGLVHFVDNAAGKVQHNCNCCGCACWNVGSIRRRKIPRDRLMAVYFRRETYPDRCTGCGSCVEACPVDALRVEDGTARVDPDWCIGCGVCARPCDFEAVRIEPRPDRSDLPPTFRDLHRQIRRERRNPSPRGGTPSS